MSPYGLNGLSRYTAAPEAANGVLDGWLSREELGAQLGLSASTLKRWEGARTGPPCVRVGRRIVYRLEAVRDWLREQEARKPPSKSGGRR